LRATQNIEAEIKVRGENAHSAVERFAQAVENPKVYGNEEGMHKLNIKDEEREGRVVVDRFDKLERSLSDFQQSISQFIEEEVRNQVGKVERENVELRSEVKRLCSELEPLKEEAHRSNWIGSLRKHFGTDKVTAL
jgi:cell division protein FtsB